MGQTSSSTSVSTSPALSSDTNLPNEYGYPHHQQSNPYPPSSQPEGDSPAPPPSDGYRWRKYGQKSVKGSAYARNYYKCTYPGCTVKKQVDKINSNGKIVDQVLCKGEHCHGPPQITRINAHDQQTFRNSVINESLAHTEIMVKQEDPPRTGYSSGGEGGGMPRGRGNSATSTTVVAVSGGATGGVGHDSYHAASSLYQLPAVTYDHHTTAGIRGGGYATTDLIHSTSNSNGVTNKVEHPIPNTLKSSNTPITSPDTGHSNAMTEPGKNNEHETIPKSILSNSNTIVTPTTTVSSPRLVIETNTNVDCLDDGYHWRKYGQKTVKGSPFPRSYYKCTEKGCSVKKQVEQNGTSIVNTYEGTHTHLAPAMDDSSDLVKKRRSRRSEPELNTPYKRLHTSLDDLADKSATTNSSDTQSSGTNTQFHTPMPIGSMGSILHHTSHLQTSISQLGAPTLPNLYSTSTAASTVVAAPTEARNFSSLSAISNGPKGRVEPGLALAPLHSFSLTDSPSSVPIPPFSSNTTSSISIHSLSSKASTDTL